MDYKVGQKVRVFKVVHYTKTGLVVEHETYTVDGDPNGEPLCLRLDVGEDSRTGFGHYGPQALHFHEVSFTEEEAVRRWRAEKLVEAIQAEHRAAAIRRELAKPIQRGVGGGERGRYVPEDKDQVRMRFEEK